MARKNNCLLSSIFPVGEGGFGQMMYRSLERSPKDPRDGIFLYSAQASFSWLRVDLARLLRRGYSRSVWIIFFEFAKVCGIRFSSGKVSLVSISAAILFLRSWHVYFPLEFKFREKVVLKGSMAAKMASRVSYLVYYYCI